MFLRVDKSGQNTSESWYVVAYINLALANISEQERFQEAFSTNEVESAAGLLLFP